MHHPSFHRSLIASTLLVLGALVGGCAGSIGSNPGYVSDYESGRYSEAQHRATLVSRDPGRNMEASLIAGLAAYELGDDAEARRWLMPVTRASDRELAGRAAATLGLLARTRSDHENAAAFLSQACSHLTGNEAARAGLHAGDAYRALGRIDAARMQYHLALALASDPELISSLKTRTDTTAYTVQVGAYRSLDNAKRSRNELAAKTDRLGLGIPQVVIDQAPGGQSLYLVQVGEFTSRRDADDARRSLGISSIVTTAAVDELD